MRSEQKPMDVLRHGSAERTTAARIAAEFHEQLRGELDLEQVLRRTLEAIHLHVGATNVAIFLPANDGSFALGGYMNYNMDRQAAAVLLPHLVEVAGPLIAESRGVTHLTDRDELYHWLHDDSAWLEDMQVIGVPCRDGLSFMAGLMLFRDDREPFGGEAVATLTALGATLAVQLSRVLGVHHRLRGL